MSWLLFCLLWPLSLSLSAFSLPCSEDHSSRISTCPYGFVGFPWDFGMETKFLGNIMTFSLYSPPTQFIEEFHVPEKCYSQPGFSVPQSTHGRIRSTLSAFSPHIQQYGPTSAHCRIPTLTMEENITQHWEHGLLKEDSQILIPSSHSTYPLCNSGSLLWSSFSLSIK